jgi:hypothetical protein
VSENEVRQFQKTLGEALWEAPNREAKAIKNEKVIAWALVEIALTLRDLRNHFILTKPR